MRGPDYKLFCALLVVLLHGLLFWFLDRTPRKPPPDVVSQLGQLVFIEPEIHQNVLEDNPSTSARPKPAHTASGGMDTGPRPSDRGDSVGPMHQVSGIPAQMDWEQQAKQVVQDMLASGALDSTSVSREPRKKPPPISWTHAAKGRVETIPGGGVVVWLNERCAVLVILIPLAVCKMGKQPGDGEIFEAMKQAEAGDWK